MKGRHGFQRLRIRRQLAIFLAAAVLILLLTDRIVSSLTTRIVLRHNLQYADDTAAKFVRELEYTNQQALSLMNTLQYSDFIQSYFRQEPDTREYPFYQEAEQFLTSFYLIYPQLDDIGLLGRYPNVNTVRDRDLYPILDRHPSPSEMECDGILTQTGSCGEKYKVLVYIRNYYGGGLGTSYAHSVGKCLLTFRLWENAADENGSLFLLIDGQLRYTPLNCRDEDAQAVLAHLNPDGPNGSIDTDQFFLRTYPVGSSGLSVVSYTDKQELLREVNQVRLLYFCLCGIAIAVLVLMILLVNRNVVSPIDRLRRYMRALAAGNYTQAQKAEGRGNLETEELAEDLNLLLEELSSRAARICAMEQERRQAAEASLLWSQINPHFLYNSLETIQGMCMREGLPEAARMIQGLGKIFRYSVKGKEIVPFRQELDVARAYTDIQLVRFSRRAEVLYGVSDAVLDVPVMKMVLQPLVENVFQHAVGQSAGLVTVYIAGAFREGDLVITVQDDGPGIPPERMEQIRHSLEEDAHSEGIGLLNVHLRIRQRYGAGYGLTLESQPGEGTKVILRLPSGQETANDRILSLPDKESMD